MSDQTNENAATELTAFEQNLHTNTLLTSLTQQRDAAMNDVIRLSANIAVLEHRNTAANSEIASFRAMLPNIAKQQKEQLEAQKAEGDAIIAVRDDEITRLKNALAAATGTAPVLSEEESIAEQEVQVTDPAAVQQ